MVRLFSVAPKMRKVNSTRLGGLGTGGVSDIGMGGVQERDKTLKVHLLGPSFGRLLPFNIWFKGDVVSHVESRI